MSRTDKTDPWWVKKDRYGIEHHNHENVFVTALIVLQATVGGA